MKKNKIISTIISNKRKLWHAKKLTKKSRNDTIFTYFDHNYLSNTMFFKKNILSFYWRKQWEKKIIKKLTIIRRKKENKKPQRHQLPKFFHRRRMSKIEILWLAEKHCWRENESSTAALLRRWNKIPYWFPLFYRLKLSFLLVIWNKREKYSNLKIINF